jgi:hypothetical protein
LNRALEALKLDVLRRKGPERAEEGEVGVEGVGGGRSRRAPTPKYGR